MLSKEKCDSIDQAGNARPFAWGRSSEADNDDVREKAEITLCAFSSIQAHSRYIY